MYFSLSNFNILFLKEKIKDIKLFSNFLRDIYSKGMLCTQVSKEENFKVEKIGMREVKGVG